VNVPITDTVLKSGKRLTIDAPPPGTATARLPRKLFASGLLPPPAHAIAIFASITSAPNEGPGVGLLVGVVGETVGEVGAAVGVAVGACVNGAPVGCSVGVSDSSDARGPRVGASVGAVEKRGPQVGATVGDTEIIGDSVGALEKSVGVIVGAVVMPRNLIVQPTSHERPQLFTSPEHISARSFTCRMHPLLRHDAPQNV